MKFPVWNKALSFSAALCVAVLIGLSALFAQTPTTTAPAEDCLYGIQPFIATPYGEDDPYLEDIHDIGLKWVRVGFFNDRTYWDWIEETKGNYYVDPVTEQAISDLEQNGCQIMLALLYSNEMYLEDSTSNSTAGHHWPMEDRWYEAGNRRALTSPEEIEAFADYAAFMAEHFRDRIQYFEIWNEENFHYNSGLPFGVGNDYYAEILLQSSRAIKQVNPKAKVVLGGTGWFAFKFVDEVLEYINGRLGQGEKISDVVDVVAFHPYKLSFRPENAVYCWQDNHTHWYGAPPDPYYYYPDIQTYEDEVSYLKDIVSSYDEKIDLWSDEYFWPTAYFNAHHALTQAKYVGRQMLMDNALSIRSFSYNLNEGNGWSFLEGENLFYSPGFQKVNSCWQFEGIGTTTVIGPSAEALQYDKYLKINGDVSIYQTLASPVYPYPVIPGTSYTFSAAFNILDQGEVYLEITTYDSDGNYLETITSDPLNWPTHGWRRIEVTAELAPSVYFISPTIVIASASPEVRLDIVNFQNNQEKPLLVSDLNDVWQGTWSTPITDMDTVIFEFLSGEEDAKLGEFIFQGGQEPVYVDYDPQPMMLEEIVGIAPGTGLDVSQGNFNGELFAADVGEFVIYSNGFPPEWNPYASGTPEVSVSYTGGYAVKAGDTLEVTHIKQGETKKSLIYFPDKVDLDAHGGIFYVAANGSSYWNEELTDQAYIANRPLKIKLTSNIPEEVNVNVDVLQLSYVGEDGLDKEVDVYLTPLNHENAPDGMILEVAENGSTSAEVGYAPLYAGQPPRNRHQLPEKRYSYRPVYYLTRTISEFMESGSLRRVNDANPQFDLTLSSPTPSIRDYGFVRGNRLVIALWDAIDAIESVQDSYPYPSTNLVLSDKTFYDRNAPIQLIDSLKHHLFESDAASINDTGDDLIIEDVPIKDYPMLVEVNLIDSDDDGLANLIETAPGPYVDSTCTGSDPQQADTDGDGLSDGEEVLTLHTSPVDDDSDNDGLSDGEEYNYWESIQPGLATTDSDGDGLANILDSDSDNDGWNDLVEIIMGSDPLDPSSFPSNSPLLIQDTSDIQHINFQYTGAIEEDAYEIGLQGTRIVGGDMFIGAVNTGTLSPPYNPDGFFVSNEATGHPALPAALPVRLEVNNISEAAGNGQPDIPAGGQIEVEYTVNGVDYQTMVIYLPRITEFGTTLYVGADGATYHDPALTQPT